MAHAYTHSVEKSGFDWRETGIATPCKGAAHD